MVSRSPLPPDWLVQHEHDYHHANSTTPDSTQDPNETQFESDSCYTLRAWGYSNAELERLRQSNPDFLYHRSEKDYLASLAQHVQQQAAGKRSVEELLRLREPEMKRLQIAQTTVTSAWAKWLEQRRVNADPAVVASFDFYTICELIVQWLHDDLPTSPTSSP